MIDVILPCLDEEGALPWVLSNLPEGYRGLVVDNGSKDNTIQVAHAHGARVIEERSKGYGAAVHAGLEAATSEVVAIMDADATLDPGELPRLVERLKEADLVMGRRRPDPGAWPLLGRLGNVVIAWEMRRSSGVKVYDLGPMRVARREDLLGLGIEDRRFGYPLEMVVKAGRFQWRVVEEDVTYRLRTTGKSKVTGSLKGSLRTVRDMSLVLKNA